MLNRYSYWIPFTKFVAEYQTIESSDIPKLVALVQLLTNYTMLDATFVYECFAFALRTLFSLISHLPISSDLPSRTLDDQILLIY